jgi:hypothetical protein
VQSDRPNGCRDQSIAAGSRPGRRIRARVVGWTQYFQEKENNDHPRSMRHVYGPQNVDIRIPDASWQIGRWCQIGRFVGQSANSASATMRR